MVYSFLKNICAPRNEITGIFTNNTCHKICTNYSFPLVEMYAPLMEDFLHANRFKRKL